MPVGSVMSRLTSKTQNANEFRASRNILFAMGFEQVHTLWTHLLNLSSRISFFKKIKNAYVQL